jgi:signal transduction histidine kinase
MSIDTLPTRPVLDNAVKYGPPGQVVEVGVERSGAGGATVWVDDEGPGIPEPSRRAIWDPYVRLGRDRDSAVGGSGIGLAVVRQTVEACGGDTRVESGRRDRGARFVLDLPAPLSA